MLYKYEMHCHTSECSICARSKSIDMVRAFKSAGYSGLVITDHFIHGNTAVPRNLPWDERMRRYYASYLTAKAEGEELDFDVIFGLEHAYGDGKEVLIYGIDLDFLLKNPGIQTISIKEFAEKVHEAGGFIVQAHPFRIREYINMDVMPEADLLDGVEVYNHCNLPEENLLAQKYALSHNFIQISGSDSHSQTNEGSAGIAFPYRVRTGTELVGALLKREGRLIINGRISRKNI